MQRRSGTVMLARRRNTTSKRMAGAASARCGGWTHSIRKSSAPGSSTLSGYTNGARPDTRSMESISTSTNGRHWRKSPDGLPCRISRRRRAYWAGLFDGLAGATIQRIKRSAREIIQNKPATAKQNSPASTQAPRRTESSSQKAARTTRPPINATNRVTIDPMLRRGREKNNGR